jgi:hypothetical protein
MRLAVVELNPELTLTTAFTAFDHPVVVKFVVALKLATRTAEVPEPTVLNEASIRIIAVSIASVPAPKVA